jgi:hypothetical protein
LKHGADIHGSAAHDSSPPFVFKNSCLFKTLVINFMGPWKSVAKIEWETMAWVSWYNPERLDSAIGYVPPQEVQEAFYESVNQDQKAA